MAKTIMAAISEPAFERRSFLTKNVALALRNLQVLAVVNVFAKVSNLVLWLAPTLLRVSALAGFKASSLVLWNLEFLARHRKVADRLHCFVMTVLANVRLLCSVLARMLRNLR